MDDTQQSIMEHISFDGSSTPLDFGFVNHKLTGKDGKDCTEKVVSREVYTETRN